MMNTYKVELTQRSTVKSRIIEADSKDDVDLIKCAYEMGFAGIGSIGVTEVKEHRVMWIEHHSWEGFATDEDDAEHRAIEYAETQNTFDDYGRFDVEEIEPDRPEIEVSFTLLHKYKRSVGTSGNYMVLLS